MQLPIAIHKDDGTVYGVTVPDVPGCFSHGDTIEEAISNSKEAVYFHLESLLEDGEDVVVNPSKIEDLLADPDYSGATWAFVEIDMSKLDTKPERVNISLPHYVLEKIDAHAKANHETRSGFIARAAMRELANA